MAGPAVARFAESHGYIGARANFARLQRIPAAAWTGEMIATAEDAVGEN
jgi:hypothetical protein